MTTKELPYIHFLASSNDDIDNGLITVPESDDSQGGGYQFYHLL